MKQLLFYLFTKETVSAVGSTVAGSAVKAALTRMGFDEKAKKPEEHKPLAEDFVEDEKLKKVYDEYFRPLFPEFGPGESTKSFGYTARRRVPIRYAVKYFKEEHPYRHREIAKMMDKLKAYYLEKPGQWQLTGKHHTPDEISDHKLFIVSLLVTILHEIDELVMPGETYKPIMQARLAKVSQLCAKLKANDDLMQYSFGVDAKVDKLEKDIRLPFVLTEIVNDIDKYFEHCAVLDSRRVLRDNLSDISQRLERIDCHLKDLFWMFGLNHDMQHDLTVDLRNVEILKATHSYDEFRRRQSAGDYDGTAVATIIINPELYDFFRAFFGIMSVDNKEQAEKLIDGIQAWAELPFHEQHLAVHKVNLVALLMKQSQLHKLRRDLPKAVQTANTFGASATLFAGEEIKGLIGDISTCLGKESKETDSDNLSKIINDIAASAEQLTSHTVRNSAGTPFSKTAAYSVELQKAITTDASEVAECKEKVVGSLNIAAVSAQLQQGNAELSQLMQHIPQEILAPTKLFEKPDDEKKKTDAKEIKDSEGRKKETPASSSEQGPYARKDVVAITLTSSINTVFRIYRDFAIQNRITGNRNLAEYDESKIQHRWFRSNIAHLSVINPVMYFNTTHERIYKSTILKQLSGLLRDYFVTKKKASFLVSLHADQEKIIDHKLFAIGFLLKMIDDLDNQYAERSANSDTFHQRLDEIYKFCGALDKDQTVTNFGVTRKAKNFALCLRNMKKVIASHSIEYHSLKNQTAFQDSIVVALGALNVTHYNFQKMLLGICFKDKEIPADILVHDGTRKMLAQCSDYIECQERKEYKGSPLSKIVKDESSFEFFKYCVISAEKNNAHSFRSEIVTTFILKQLSLKKEEEKSDEAKAYVTSISQVMEDLYTMNDCIKNLEIMRTAADAFGEVTALMAYDKIKAAIEKMQKVLSSLTDHTKNAEKTGVSLMQKIKLGEAPLAQRIQGISAFLDMVQGQIMVAAQAIDKMTAAMDPARVLNQMGNSVDNIASLVEYRSDRQENPKLGYIQLFMASCSQHHKLARALLGKESIDNTRLFNNRKKIINIIRTEVFSILAGKNSEYSMNRLLTTWQQLNNVMFTTDQQLLSVFNEELVNPLHFDEGGRITLNELSRLTLNGKSALWTAVQQQRQLSQLTELVSLQIRVPQEYKQRLDPDYLSILQSLMAVCFKNQKEIPFAYWPMITSPASLVSKLAGIRSSYAASKTQSLKLCSEKLIRIIDSDIYAGWDLARISEVKALVSGQQKYIATNAERLTIFYTAVLTAKEDKEGKLSDIPRPKILTPSVALGDQDAKTELGSDSVEMEEVDSGQEQINTYILRVIDKLSAKDYLTSSEKIRFINGYRYLKSHPFNDQTKNHSLEHFHEKFNAISAGVKTNLKESDVSSIAMSDMFRRLSPQQIKKRLGEQLQQDQPFTLEATWYKEHAEDIEELASLKDLKEYALAFWDMLLRHLNRWALIDKRALVPDVTRVIAIKIHNAILENKHLKEDVIWKVDAIKGSVALFKDTQATVSNAIKELAGYKQKLEKELGCAHIPAVTL